MISFYSFSEVCHPCVCLSIYSFNFAFVSSSCFYRSNYVFKLLKFKAIYLVSILTRSKISFLWVFFVIILKSLSSFSYAIFALILCLFFFFNFLFLKMLGFFFLGNTVLRSLEWKTVQVSIFDSPVDLAIWLLLDFIFPQLVEIGSYRSAYNSLSSISHIDLLFSTNNLCFCNLSLSSFLPVSVCYQGMFLPQYSLTVSVDLNKEMLVFPT